MLQRSVDAMVFVLLKHATKMYSLRSNILKDVDGELEMLLATAG